MLHRIFFKYYTYLQRRKQKQYGRSLPLGELLVGRQKKAKLLGFSKGVTIHDSSHVYGNVKVGENTWIGPFTILDGSGGLTIGANCSISAGVQIYSHNSVSWAVSGGKSPYEYKKVIIENDCYIGPNSTIQSGVIIKKGSIVGANSFVNKTFPPGSKIAGNPARLM